MIYSNLILWPVNYKVNRLLHGLLYRFKKKKKLLLFCFVLFWAKNAAN